MTNQLKSFNFTQTQAAKLCEMQDKLNSYIHPQWKEQNFAWDLAIIDECMEIHGHLGWKWWKKDYKVGLTEANRKQVQLEVIDILHFVLSDWLESGRDYYLSESLNQPQDAEGNPTVNDLIYAASAGANYEYVGYLVRLAHQVGLTQQQIMETYTQKYVLNKFRQDHGYKTGEYVKEWVQEIDVGLIAGELSSCKLKVTKEDNEVLTDIVHDIDSDGEDTTDEVELYKRLEQAYNSRLNQ